VLKTAGLVKKYSKLEEEDVISYFENLLRKNEQWITEKGKCHIAYCSREGLERFVKEGIDLGQIKKGDSKVIASEIYGLICSALVCKMRAGENFSVMDLYNEFENTIIKGLKFDK